VSCTPDGTSIQFLKLLRDYLDQSKAELNYVEAQRAQNKLKELADHELKRQMQRMEAKQREELLQIEAIQRSQFEEFTNAWDEYMQSYEVTAIESIQRLKKEQESEIAAMRQSYQGSPHKYNKSKKLTQYRTLEQKNFATKNYDGATYFKYLGDELEEFEKLTAMERDDFKYIKLEEQKLKSQTVFMTNFLKRI